MKKSILLFSLSVLLAAGGISGCKDVLEEPVASTGTSDLDRKALLTQWADTLVRPGYQRAGTKLTALKSQTATFTAAPTVASLQAVRLAWREAYVEWQKVEMFEFGPAADVSLVNHFNIYPTDVAGIRQNIASGSYNFELATAIPQQGFPALDFLLNGVAADDNAIVQSYLASANQRRYLTDVVGKMDQLMTGVQTQWNGAYRTTFINNTGTNAGSSLSLLVNAFSRYYEHFLRTGKIGIPAGVMSGTAAPEKIEAYYHRGTLPVQLAQTAHAAVQTAFNGRSGQPSLKAYVTALGAKDSRTGQSLAQLITDQFVVSAAQLATLGPDLYATMQARPAAAVQAYGEMQKAVRLIKVDMTSAMSVSVTYVDNDGD
ncbi:imelysin family protein [Hymenobacter armeniacus]|uniref:Imelysin family protein n=1 Tax=Hymenobacter armeniacus TaxID=2771358 RepID=A0ABR8JPR8_9BACT|nr:imelysin family protein [Hymenobacter armeniacus]MBD2721987.1 imelysin family protein [Hymenobacter armeniacus]